MTTFNSHNDFKPQYIGEECLVLTVQEKYDSRLCPVRILFEKKNKNVPSTIK